MVVGAESCDDGFTDACGGCNADCSAPGDGAMCGDGEVCPESEVCDDGFADACGSCNADCSAPGSGATCGDGVSCEELEECDDGSVGDGDGCDAACTVEAGYICDGEPGDCNLSPSWAGDVFVTELMRDPAPPVDDARGEWIELYNPGVRGDFDLFGLTLADRGTESHVIAAHVVIPAGGYVVLGASAAMADNGGVAVDYEYAGFTLDDDGDEVILSNGATVIDEFDYAAADLPSTEGAALSLNSNTLGAGENDFPANWCDAVDPYGPSGAQLGTPGLANPICTRPVPPGWTCDSLRFGDGTCDCGCGAFDVDDCADATVDSCAVCREFGSTGGCNLDPMATCPGTIDPVNNAVCTATPPAWTCEATLFAPNGLCFCGCGVPDPDCADATVGSCLICNAVGSCGSDFCPANIDPADNTQCL